MEPLISVVIPTFNRERILSLVLESLTKQTLATHLFEIIIVDDGSTDQTKALVKSFSNLLQIKYYPIKKIGNNAGIPKNRGAEMARGKYIVFLDSDIFCLPHTLENHLKALDQSERAVILGYRYEAQTKQILLENEGRNGLLPDIRQDLFDRGGPSEYYLWRSLFGHNFSLSRELFFEVNGFDENFTSWGHEDIELGYRLMLNGADFFVARGAEGIHYPHLRGKNEGSSMDLNAVYFFEKHPTIEIEILFAKPFLDNKYNYNYIKQIIHSLEPIKMKKDDYESLKPDLLIGPADRSDVISVNHISVRREDNPDYELVGCKLPYSNKQFDHVLITDWWRVLPLEMLNHMIRESCRVGKRVLIACDPDLTPDPSLIWWDSIEDLLTVSSGYFEIHPFKHETLCVYSLKEV